MRGHLVPAQRQGGGGRDPRMADMDPADMPVDMKRLIYGGFEVMVEA
jgi:uncharacterized protein YbaA (DUF1428 family)